MDEGTLNALAALGWKWHLGRNDAGPYLAFVRGGDFFHVTLDSRLTLGDVRREYVPGRQAQTVVAMERNP